MESDNRDEKCTRRSSDESELCEAESSSDEFVTGNEARAVLDAAQREIEDEFKFVIDVTHQLGHTPGVRPASTAPHSAAWTAPVSPQQGLTPYFEARSAPLGSGSWMHNSHFHSALASAVQCAGPSSTAVTAPHASIAPAVDAEVRLLSSAAAQPGSPALQLKSGRTELATPSF
jgi:hypothetical protein